MKNLMMDAAPEAEWELWYQDTFDRECPRQVEIAGQGLVRGLVELWARHLLETVRADGQQGFSRFNLWWKQKGQSIEVLGEWAGLTRLRVWIYGDIPHTDKGYRQEGDAELLVKVALTHSSLVLSGQTSEPILAAARDATSREDFVARLLKLEEV